MQILNLIQGTPEWKAARSIRFTASEAPAMKGVSKYQKRDELLHTKKTGEEKEFDEFTLKLFAKGHAIEALARPIAEKIIGEQLFPCTGVNKISGIDLLASFDGLTMDQRIAWECKSWNEEKAANVRSDILPLTDFWQVIQQLVLSEADKLLYMVTDGTPEKTVSMWVELEQAETIDLLSGWKQFDEDLKSYEHVEADQKATAEPTLGLPAVSIKVDGEIALIDNLDVFGIALEEYVSNINKEPKTDQDFANLELAVKVLKEAEDTLTSSENNALAQAEDIDTMRRKVELFRSLARSNRLTTEKLVKNEKAARKLEIATNAEKARLEHQAKLNKSLGGNYLDSVRGDFNSAMKGKKTIISLQSAANDELARCKIIANELFLIIEINLKKIPEEYNFLFNDLSLIVEKQPDDFALLVDSRINEHKKTEEARAEALRAQAVIDAQKIVDDKKAEDERIALAEKEKLEEPVTETPKEEVMKQADTGNESVHVQPENDANVVATKLSRSGPSGDQMIAVLMNYYEVSEGTIINWLSNKIDLSNKKNVA